MSSDHACPFCYLGFLRLERLREQYDLRVNWCMTEIRPDLRSDRSVQRARLFGRTVAPDGGGSRPPWRPGGSALERFQPRKLLAPRAAACRSRQGAGRHRLLSSPQAVVRGRSMRRPQSCGRSGVARRSSLAWSRPAAAERAWRDLRYGQRLKEYALAARELRVDATSTFFFHHTPLRGPQSVDTLYAAAHPACACRQDADLAF